jgi:preprotein translocase subunit SecG
MIHFAQMHATIAALGWLKTPLMVLFFLCGIILIFVVLMQATKGAGLAGAFGMGGDTTVLGTRAGTFLGKVTVVLAAVFLLLALVYSLIFQSERPFPSEKNKQQQNQGEQP